MDELRQALRRLAKAVAVITSSYEGKRYAMAATAVSELSLDPPSMLVCVNRNASIYFPLAAGTPFAINILHHSQREIANRCAGAVKGDERFLQGDWINTNLDIPRLGESQASIVCQNVRQIQHGSHAIFIGVVDEIFVCGGVDPLIYLDGRYTRSQALEL